MKLLNNTAAFFTNLYTKYESKAFVIKLTEFYIKFERKSLVSRCLFLSAFAHAFVLFPSAFLPHHELIDEKPVGIEISLGNNFGGSPEFRPLDEIDAKPAPAPVVQKEELQTTTKNDAAKAEIKVSNVTKIKPKTSTEASADNAQPASGSPAPQIAPEDYLELLQYTVEDLSEVPDGGEKLKGVAVLRLEFTRQGFVTRYTLKKATGQPILDAAANTVARRLMNEPFPAAPDGFDKGEKVLRYDFLIKYPPKPRVTSHS